MDRFRKVIFWLHLVAGVVGGIVIFIMCVTGALLSFEKDIAEFAERDMRFVTQPANAERLPAREILARVGAAKPNAKPSAIALPNRQPNAAWQVSLGRDGQVFVNPFTGEITGEGATGWRSFFRTTTDLHRWLALSGDGRAFGKAVTGACNLMFLFLAISGIYIWFPRRLTGKHFRAALTPRWQVSGKARDFNWHTVFGFWTSLILIVLTLTATVISYQWASNLLYTLTGNEVPAQQQQQASPNTPGAQNEQPAVLPENLDAVWAKAENQVTGWKSISLRLPITKDSAVFTIDEGIYWNRFGRSTLTVDTKTAEAAKWESYGEQNSARRLRSWFRFTHTGETGGFIGQLVGFIACVVGAVLVWTGFSLAVRRFWSWRARKPAAEEQ